MSKLDQRVGELVAQDYRTAHVFSQFNIDFCCGGGRLLSKAIERAGADETSVLAALETLLFLLAIPGSALVAESWHWPLTGGLIAAAWLINGGVGGLYWYQHRPPREAPQPDQ